MDELTSLASPHPDKVLRAVAKRNFATLATVSPAGRPHVAGVLYAFADGRVYVSVERASRKCRNVAAHPAVHLSIPVRRAPVGPPATVQFAATAEVLDNDDPHVRALAAAGRLRAITSHGELDLGGGCILRITPERRWHTYGLGLPLLTLIREPLRAGGSVEVPPAAALPRRAVAAAR
jgi:hypothetical protein